MSLSRANARNALTIAMIEELTQALQDFRNMPEVKVVLIKSEIPGTFCSGGDVRAVALLRRDGRHEEADKFFEREFAINRMIHDYPKPYVSLIDGTCFGGGMGLTIHGWHRIVGDAAVLAMPETAIGYFPDVGASHFLNKLPVPMARFIGLTGYKLLPGDALFLGLATAYVPSDRHLDFEEGLAEGRAIEDLLKVLSQTPKEGRLSRNIELVDRCFSRPSVGIIKDALRNEQDEFAAEALGMLQYAAPSSLDVTLRLLNRTIGLPIADCLEIELELAKQVTRGSDFSEGIRALLVDKDRSPRWDPARGNAI